MNFRNVDLNLLVVFDALYTLRNGTAAARKLNMAQPNLSRALKQLRQQFDEELFVRTSHGLTATARSHELAPQIRQVLDNAEKVYRPAAFDLKNLRDRLTIGTTDYMEVMAADRLMEVVGREAPGLTINFRPLVGHLPKDELERGDMDLAMAGYFGSPPGGYFRQKLFEDPFVLVMRPKHPLLKLGKKMTTDDMLQYSFALISTRGDLIAGLDRKLERLGRTRHIALAVPNSLSAVWAIMRSDLILVASQRFIERVGESLPVATMPLPIKLDAIQMVQVWHERTHKDPLRQWLRQRIFEIVQP
jgi:DNA-binding transcriptional LysR family regulator